MHFCLSIYVFFFVVAAAVVDFCLFLAKSSSDGSSIAFNDTPYFSAILPARESNRLLRTPTAEAVELEEVLEVELEEVVDDVVDDDDLCFSF
jgi:hypothetical protein